MTDWKDLLPADEVFVRLAAHRVTELRVDTDAAEPWGSVGISDASGNVLMLSWDYVDVEFKFEIYAASVDESGADRAAEWKPVATVPPGANIHFLVRAAWLRPASPGEVPETYEQVIEEAGRQSSAPASATVGGLALRGVALFRDEEDCPCAVIGVDDDVSYSLRWISEGDAVARYLEDCDVLDLESLRRMRRGM